MNFNISLQIKVLPLSNYHLLITILFYKQSKEKLKLQLVRAFVFIWGLTSGSPRENVVAEKLPRSLQLRETAVTSLTQ